MRQYKLAAALFAASILAGCGGGGAGDQAPKVQYSSMVTFGDSLSDVGTYAVSGVQASMPVAGPFGQFTVNGGKNTNWTELMAAQLGLPAPCAAIKGGFGTVAAPQAGCNAHAMGGARVTNPLGTGNKGMVPGTSIPYGALTYPVATQIVNHGVFTGNEIVFVLAGANDVMNLAEGYQAAVTTIYTAGAAGGMTLPQAKAQALTQLIGDITAVANDLATQVKTVIIQTGGAKRVVVVNIPDVSNTPSANLAETVAVGSKALLDALVTAFNTTLKTQLANNANVLLVDAYTINRDEINNQAAYGLTNVTGTACDVMGVLLDKTDPLKPVPGSSLICNAATLTSSAVDTNHYLFADGVHPTPYGYLLLARLVSKDMLIRGWM